MAPTHNNIQEYLSSLGLSEELLLFFRENYLVITVALLLILYLFSVSRKKFKPQRISKVNRMSQKGFVSYMHTYFLSKRYRVEAKPASGVFGADLILFKHRKKIVIRIVLSKKNVGLSAIQEVVGAVGYHKAKKGIVITNAKYTKPAKRLAKTNNVEIWDRNTLIKKKIVKGR